MKQRRPMKPFKTAVWCEERGRWEGLKGLKKGYGDLPKKKGPQKRMGKVGVNGNGHFKVTRLRPKSATQKKEDALYAKLKPIWRANPRNHYCKAICHDLHIKTPSEQYPHHIRGRGKLLCSVEYWLPVCQACHNWIETHRQAARLKGWLASRDSKTIKLQTNPRKQHAL